MSEIGKVLEHLRSGKSIGFDELVTWHCRWRIDTYHGIDLELPYWKERWERGQLSPDETIEDEGNILTTIGATDMFNGLVTAGLATPWNSTNTAIAIGDSNTAATAAQTDVQAAAGTKLNAADVVTASNTTPIIIAGTFSPVPTVGALVACSGFGGAGAAAINQTFELQLASAASLTLLNSAGAGAITVAGGVIKPVNRYLQILNGAPVVSTNTAQFVSLFGANNGNFTWAEFATMLGQSATNKQAAPPTKMLNRAVAANGTKAQGSSATFTETCTIT